MDEEKLVEIMVDHEDRLFNVEHSLKDEYMTKQVGSDILVYLDRVAGDYKKINEELVHLGENLRRFEKDVSLRFDAVDNRLTLVEGRLTSVEVRLTSVEGRLTKVETRLDSVETRLVTVEDTLKSVDSRLVSVENYVKK